MILQKNDSLSFKVYIYCCLIFVWGSFVLGVGFLALMFFAAIFSSFQTSVV
jgi:hypothetical protein